MYKKFKTEDISNAGGRLEEKIRLQGALRRGFRKKENHFFSGAASGSYFFSLLDGATTLPWSNKVCSLAYGMHTSSVLFTYNSASELNEKNKIYRLYAKTLLGAEDSKFYINNKEQNELIFISLARNQLKDGIKPNTVQIGFIEDSDRQIPTALATDLTYYSDVVNKSYYYYRGGTAADLNVVVSGGVGFDWLQNPYDTPPVYKSSSVGLIFYEHGTAALIPHKIFLTASNRNFSGALKYPQTLSSSQNIHLDAICNKFGDFSFTNYSIPRVTFFKCTAEREEFNYSSNPSAIKATGEIVILSGGVNSNMTPTTYITQIGLCNEYGEVMAIAKITRPIKKDTTKKIEIIARLIT